MIALSSLPDHTFLSCHGEIVTKKEIVTRIQSGEIIEEVYTLDNSFMDSILQQVYTDYQQGITKEWYTANNRGKRVFLDILS
jgi:hypothetical protein